MNLRDRIIEIISPHSAGCQDPECSWCDDAISRADQILSVVVDDLLEHGWRDVAVRMDRWCDAGYFGNWTDERYAR